MVTKKWTSRLRDFSTFSSITVRKETSQNSKVFIWMIFRMEHEKPSYFVSQSESSTKKAFNFVSQSESSFKWPEISRPGWRSLLGSRLAIAYLKTWWPPPPPPPQLTLLLLTKKTYFNHNRLIINNLKSLSPSYLGIMLSLFVKLKK